MSDVLLAPERTGPSPLRRVVGVAALFLALLVGLAIVGPERAALAARAAFDTAGWGGLWLFTAFVDPIPGVGFQPTLMVAAAAELPTVPVVLMCGSASFVAALAMAVLGRTTPHTSSRWGDKLRGGGAKTIAILALSPVPFGLVAYGAGAVGMPLPVFARGAAFRAIKVLIMWYVTLGAWKSGVALIGS